MKILAPLLLTGALCGAAHASVIAFWDFNNGYDVPNNSPQIVFNATAGSGTLYQQRADTDGNGKGGNAFVDPANSLNVVAGKSMAWDDVAKSGANDAEFFVTFSTFNFTDIVVSFDISGNAGGGIASFDLKYAFNPLQDVTNPPDVTGTIKDFQGGLSTEIFNNQPVSAPATSFTRVTLPLSMIANQGFVALRFDDWKENDALSIDNFLVTGTAIPEPSALLLGALGALGLLRRRR